MDYTLKINLELGRILRQWDPFQTGEDFYDTEAADVIQAVHQLDDQEKLALKIKEIYEFSFDEQLTLASCRQVAEKLLQVKNQSSCEL
ncbi:DUF1871 family protein [Bacillus xiapuensis]|uniref:DUF1871 family protein n=1 Tax=Bacillus xiapuensis TaxID=2014075 RepID=UPI000C2394CB|nr:DUF1871 family protein [Bacillus xiapuensis]